jgi:hypothetical protein
MTGLATIAPKLNPLIRRLATDRDGEIVACVRAIGRQLDRAGLTFHDLADRLVTTPLAPVEAPGTNVFHDYSTAVEWILRTDCGLLTAHEIRFIESMREILLRWPPRPKQAAWIRVLLEKLGGRFDG